MTTRNGPPRVVIYTRVSSDRDGGGRSVGEQEEECRAEAERRAWDVVQVLVDNSYSATRWARRARPAYAKLAEVLASGEVDILLTWEASRAQRDLAAYVALRDLCVQNEVQWSYGGRVYDLTNDDDRFQTGLDALVAEREAGLTRTRTVRGAPERAASGRPFGRLLDGYKTTYDPATGKATGRVLDPERAPIIREVADRLLAGDSAYSIAADFNRRGLKTRRGMPWTGGNIVKRIQTPTLAGLRVFRGNVLEDVATTWPPIITVEEHHRLIAILKDPGRKANREGNRVRWMGTGIYRCAVCGGPMRMISARRKDGSRRVRYTCDSLPGAKRKFCVQRAAELTDGKVSAVVAAFLSRPDVIRELADTDPDGEVQAAQAEAARLRVQLDDARARVRREEITLDDFVAFRGTWEPKLAAAQEKARPRWVPSAVYDIAGPDAESRWEATPVTQQRAILKALFEVKVHPTDRRDGTFDADAIEVTRRPRG